MPVSQVPGAVGYDSLANFNQQFKALKGATPTAYQSRVPLDPTSRGR
ncbi:MAG: helix-turn-helix domain-containing protein [Candidatus Devosia symbiotica]|nr:helix-turn-helix domain-containing protein [Candidatus Devosia symbiotica]